MYNVSITSLVLYMKVINKHTGEDVSHHYLRQMKGEITREEFMKITGINE